MAKEAMIVTGAGQIGMAIARRMGYGKKIILGDKKPENAQRIAGIMNEAGFDVVPMEMDLSSRESILNLITEAKNAGMITMLVNAAGVSPSQASVEEKAGDGGSSKMGRKRCEDQFHLAGHHCDTAGD